MKDSIKKIILMLGAIAAIVIFCFFLNLKTVQSFQEKYEGQDLTQDVVGAQRDGTYKKYLLEYMDAVNPKTELTIDLASYSMGRGVEVKETFEGENAVLITESDSSVSWEITVSEAGFYNLYLEYMTMESRGVAVERAVYINEELPFEDAANITFSRIWTDSGALKIDNQGNEIRATQVEVYDWQKAYFRDDMGYITEPYRFYFQKGANTLRLDGVNEPIAIKAMTLKEVQKVDTYAEYMEKQNVVTASSIGMTYAEIIQGESAILRSESSLYAKYDRSSPSTQPNSVTKTILNYTGGDAWNSAGQWIGWELEVPEDGFYYITVKGRQNYSRGSVSSRALYLDGEIPFEEVREISFDYDNDWNVMTLADKEGNPYQFYLSEGTHFLQLEATLGGMGSILEDLEDCTYRLNQIYRRILVYTGATPDKYRDYNLHQVYPEIVDAMSLESKRLYKIVDEMVDYTGQKADRIATAQTLAQQLERFALRPEKVSVEFTTFKDNITALGTAVLSMSETKLDVDYIAIRGTDTSLVEDKTNGLEKVWHEVKSFFASFFVDYDSVGDVYEVKGEENVVKVWVLTGRDQGTILKSMIDDSFTTNTGIKVNVEVVAADALLSAVVAGRGPNVVLSIGADQPVNYALRNAVEDLSQFKDCAEVLKSYSESSYEQYRLGESIYAIPETQMFNVMFYRKDILEELELEVPNTWQELIEMLPTIQGNNMSVGIPTAAGSSGSASASTSIASNSPDLSLYFSLLFQNGGDLYNQEGTQTIVDNEAGVEAFSSYTKYFTDYGIPTIYDFVSRFRSGEMPIGITSYTVYNTLIVSAPEIRGLWDFTLIPGTENISENGTTYIDRSDFITGSATMMIKTEEVAVRNNAWEFMKWWSDAETQVRFGREIEALLGSSARYATANMEAFNQLSWSAHDIETLKEQWDWTVGIREVPGGYYTGRHITNAVRKVLNEQEDPRETIIDYSITIDEEISKKRIEFGLAVK